MKNFLSHKEKIDLKIQHKLEKNGRVRDRIKAVLLSNNGWNYVKIAEVLLLDNETVSKHVNEYKKDHKLHMKNNGSFSKLNIKQSEKLIKHLALKTYVKVEVEDLNLSDTSNSDSLDCSSYGGLSTFFRGSFAEINVKGQDVISSEKFFLT